MKLSDELNELINKANIPEQLRTYFKESDDGKLYLTEEMLSEIEELYIFYNALYIFDETEFSFYTITSLKRGSEATAYYYYLRKILETNLQITSQDQRFHKSSKGVFTFKIDGNNLDVVLKNIAKEFGQNVDYFYKDQYEKIDILQTYLLLGKLELINNIIDDEYYFQLYKQGRRIIDTKKKELEFKLHGSLKKVVKK